MLNKHTESVAGMYLFLEITKIQVDTSLIRVICIFLSTINFFKASQPLVMVNSKER